MYWCVMDKGFFILFYIYRINGRITLRLMVALSRGFGAKDNQGYYVVQEIMGPFGHRFQKLLIKMMWKLWF